MSCGCQDIPLSVSLHVSRQSFFQTECQLFQEFQSFNCFSRSGELFHSWFFVEKGLEAEYSPGADKSASTVDLIILS